VLGKTTFGLQKHTKLHKTLQGQYKIEHYQRINFRLMRILCTFTERMLTWNTYSNALMKNTTQGAWLINHTKKIQEYRNISHDFEDIELSGKCGILLSNLAASDEESTLSVAKVDAVRQVSGIKKSEMPAITDILAKANLVGKSRNGEIVVLGVTTSSVLGHTSDIFKNSEADNFQKAAIELSEQTSDLPKDEIILREYIADHYQLTKTNIEGLFSQVELFGFIDSEKVDTKKMYFNGNLFRHTDLKRVTAVLSSLNQEDNRKVVELENLLIEKGCVSLVAATKILGQVLIDKLKAIGMYDLNEVSNEKENIIFITKPSAFNKFGNPFEEDALDLAKAFVASLYYGINYSPANRGNITMLHALIPIKFKF
jgi:hypothetical protein